MLHKNPKIIAPKTFELIQQLQSLEFLNNFYLVGGTSLALQLGHRNSIDIDLFTQSEFDDIDLMEKLNAVYETKTIYQKKNTIISLINNVKTDFIRHNYPFILPPIEEEGIKFMSNEDISAVKLHAIIQSGKRLKDFIDIYFLLEHFSMNQMIEFFTQKYNYASPMIAVKAVNFFNDIDESIDPPQLLNPLKVSQIRKRIGEATLKSSKIFNEW